MPCPIAVRCSHRICTPTLLSAGEIPSSGVSMQCGLRPVHAYAPCLGSLGRASWRRGLRGRTTCGFPSSGHSFPSAGRLQPRDPRDPRLRRLSSYSAPVPGCLCSASLITRPSLLAIPHLHRLLQTLPTERRGLDESIAEVGRHALFGPFAPGTRFIFFQGSQYYFH